MLDVVQLLVGDVVVPGTNMKWLVLADVVSRTGGGQSSEWCPTECSRVVAQSQKVPARPPGEQRQRTSEAFV